MVELKNKWQVYIIQASDDSLYTGITTDIKRRWREHSSMQAGAKKKSSQKKGAKYFLGKTPVKLVYLELLESRSEASKREAAIKKMPRREKIVLVDSGAENQINIEAIQEYLGTDVPTH